MQGNICEQGHSPWTTLVGTSFRIKTISLLHQYDNVILAIIRQQGLLAPPPVSAKTQTQPPLIALQYLCFFIDTGLLYVMLKLPITTQTRINKKHKHYNGISIGCVYVFGNVGLKTIALKVANTILILTHRYAYLKIDEFTVIPMVM